MTIKLDDKLWVYSYKMKSKSAQTMAEALDVWMIKHEESKFNGTTTKTILNWGAGTGVFNCNVGGAKVLNTPQQVDTAVNKLDFFRKMMGDNAPRLPFWSQSMEVAKAWLAMGHTVIARTKLEGAKGSGLVVMKNPLDFVEASLYTVKVPSTAEYRVYMFGSKVLDARIKLLIEDIEPDPDGMRYAEDKYEYCRLRDSYAVLPQDVQDQAIKCITKIGLFTGGVDVLWDQDSGKATVLEVNSAPYIGQLTAEKYSQAFQEYFQGEAA
jgi:glutathione synthase/RimK-type ligase-like ATP-grasp enzyme